VPITSRECVLGGDVAAVIFGVDGVLVDSSWAAARAWKTVLDPFLRSHAAACEICCRAFDVPADYRRHMHGRTRIEGLRAFLGSCGIELTFDDLRGLAGHQEEVMLAELADQAAQPFPSTAATVTALRRHGLRTAAVSAHRYTTALLTRAGIADLFDLRLDGLDAPGTGLPEESDPGLYREAALRLGTTPAHTAVVEESPAGVAAGRRGGFGLVIGVDRAGRCEPAGRHAGALRRNGAHAVIADLADLHLCAPVG
jgi:HAD superfamily hydrolase (TIGR01509 family)